MKMGNRRRSAALTLLMAAAAFGVVLFAPQAMAQEPEAVEGVDPLLLSTIELPAGFVAEVRPNTSPQTSRDELACDERRDINLSATFVADGATTTITTTNPQPALAVYTLAGPGGFDDLELVGCPSPSEAGPGLFQRSFTTNPGQRYWVLTGDEVGMFLARDVATADDELALRFALVRPARGQSDLRSTFMFPTVDQSMPADGDAACRRTLLSFTATQSTTTLWADNADNAFAIYGSPPNDDPRSSGFGGPEILVPCANSWGPPSPTGSVRSSFETVPGDIYVIGWSSTDEAAILLDPPPDIDDIVANPLLFGNQLLDDWAPEPPCTELVALGRFALLITNRGIKDETVTARLSRLDGPVPDVRVDTQVVAPGDRSFVTAAELVGGEYQVDVIVNDVVVASRPLVVACDGRQPHSPHVQIVTSCAAELVRVDVIFENRSENPATYLVTVTHGDISHRKSSTATANGQGRLAVTGRPNDRPIYVTTFRNGEEVDRGSVIRVCTSDSTTVDRATVTTSCLGDNGLIRYALVNGRPVPSTWIISFDGLANRSTSAPARAVGFGGISGRADGTYTLTIRNAERIVYSQEITIACDR